VLAGTFQELVPGQRLVMSWRFNSWEEGCESKVRLQHCVWHRMTARPGHSMQLILHLLGLNVMFDVHVLGRVGCHACVWVARAHNTDTLCAALHLMRPGCRRVGALEAPGSGQLLSTCQLHTAGGASCACTPQQHSIWASI
jgi:hypothetical protein